MQEAEPLAYAQPQDPVDNFIDELLEEDPPVSHKLLSSVQIHPEQEEEAPQGTRQNMRRNSVMLLENQDLNCSLPEKPFQGAGEDDGENNLSLEVAGEKVQSQANSSQRKGKLAKLAYKEETRAHKIARYREKKSRRIWKRKVFYDCRKVVADSRERVNGRFVKKSPVGSFLEPTHKGSLVTGDVQSGRGEMQQVRETDDLFL